MIDARKISELPETNIMKNSSCMPIVQDGETRKIYFADLKWLFKGDKGEPGEKGDKGDTGVSIDRITVEESDVDEGENKIIILKDNGQAVAFIIRNGSKGVTMRNRGTWESGVEYVNDVTYLDIVYYPETGCSYVCNTSHTSGDILPTDTNYWTLLASKGDKGDKGDKGEKGDTGAVATVVQNTGASLDNVMSQNAVTEELKKKSNEGHNHDDRYYQKTEVDAEVSKLKSDLVAKANMLSYEEIMASTPPIDLNVGIPKASALKDSINNRPLASYYYSNISSANRDNRYDAIVELRTLTRECFNRGSIVHILNNTGGYHTYIIGSTDPDFFVVLPLTFYGDPRLELYNYNNGNWTRYYASMTQF